MLFLLFQLVVAIEYSKIPITGTPPSRTTAAAAVYDPVKNRIITFGGFNYQLNSVSSALNSFSLETLTWEEIAPHSKVVPSGLESTKLYLRADRKLFVFYGSGTSGTSNEIYCFDLLTFLWSVQGTTGDTVLGRDHFAFTSYEYKGNNYVAIYGGLTQFSIEMDLYLINIDTFVAKKISKDIKIYNQRPGLRISATLVYRNGYLYMYGYIRIALAFDAYQSGIYAYSLEDDLWTLLKNDIEPEERFLHTSYIYEDEMYVIFGGRVDSTNMSRDIWKYSFVNSNWTLIKNNIEEFRVEAATVQIGSKIYFLYGRKDVTIYNTIVAIDLGTNPIDISTISPLYDAPLKRVHHCSFTINTYIYVFGGLYEYGIYLNDLWRYDILLDYWMPVSTLGEAPSPRARFACTKSTGNSFAIYGGTNGDDIYDDLYFFQEAYMTWIKASVTGDSPSPRHSSCMTYNNYKYYILGGQDLEKGFNELWIYNFVNGTYTAASTNVFFYELIRHNCWIDVNSDYIVLNAIGGSTFWYYPNYYWIKVEIDNDDNAAAAKVVMNSSYFSLSETGIAVTKDHLYIIIGSYWDKIVAESVAIVDFSNFNVFQKFTTIQEIAIYGHSVSHYANSLYVFGGGTSVHTCKLLNTATNTFFKFTNLLSSQDGLIDCSPGTMPPDCKPCDKGTYYFNSSCVPCPKGKYSDTLAATSIEQCIPCASGYYSDIEGAVYCIQCPAGKKCPIGSSSFDNNVGTLSPSNVQPKAYKGPKSFISLTVTNMWYSILSICLFIFLCAVLIHRFWDKMNKFDLFTSNHSHSLGKPIMNIKTNVGGLFSIFFIFAAIVTATAAMLSYALDKITEIKTLIPSIALDYEIIAKSVEVNTTFYIYGGICEYNGSCVSDILYITIGLDYESISLTCIMENNNCQVNLHFTELSLASSISSINIEMREKSSYASYLGVNISSTSSIPLEYSSAFIPVDPKSSDHILRGTTPSIISYKFTPSVFISESSRWTSLETGFHISSYEDVTLGSIATQKTVNTQVYLRASISIIKSDTGMQTQRILNSSLFVFIGSLLGSIFGLMGSFGAAMGFSETFVDNYQDKANKKITVNLICKNMNRLKTEFGEWKVRTKGCRVYPSLEITTTTL
ncbi:hypothetical protein SteCoe_19167 [Stentor coeruleus]|uniref:Tyrosine-protein kinase ephrin type A/B receptor-like domain-containing protein n=1 Tax=Stentor coeruleus TaxID=5963 RepID=A0A1R2BUY0_9CILI|nr:hypothetical protein SteCoe_19167 [Stentor coeruleus]